MAYITLEIAEELARQALGKARTEFGRPICVAVCDGNGEMVYFSRMDGAPLRSIAIAQQKAYTAVRMGVSTEAFLVRLQKEHIEIGYFCDGRFTALPGGHPIKNADGIVIGGIGVSGLAASEDHVITEWVALAAKIQTN
ncbi:MAG TPA: heme-binding protein [Sporomusaceae bacterium]|uniref:GlcG/HbpS family heme-binding protein n=1 Tax=Anaerospora sp. TaxID=1960278 RepID=UPI000EC9E036|nr:heme-binding protein [Anaerospora sp.]HAK74904.1 heme-binding protein [Sporomusaceae bacterium]